MMLNIYSNRHAIVSKGLGGKLFGVVKSDSLNGIIKNCAHNLIICVKSLEKAIFHAERRQTCDHLVETFIKTIK